MLSIARIQKISSWTYSLSRLRAVDIWGKVYGNLKLKYLKSPQIIPHAYAPLSIKTWICYDPWNTQEALLDGRFCFLNKAVTGTFPPTWIHPEQSLLWRWNLHYCLFLGLLPLTKQHELCHDWIRHNPKGDQNGWNPYTLSLRLTQWCKLSELTPEIAASIADQAGYLFRHLEFYVEGNHYLENARALLFASKVVQTKESLRWAKKALKILKQELAYQSLPDGGHCERSPMYHSLMLDLWLDVYVILENHDPFKHQLKESLAKQCQAAIAMQIQGRPGFFNDSSSEIAPPVETLIARAKQAFGFQENNPTHLPDTGLYQLQNETAFILIKCGESGTKTQLAHAHSDHLSFELSVKGQLLFTNTGIYAYHDPEMRQYCRSAKAHNCLVVGGVDQFEYISPFRVARRSYSTLESWDYPKRFSGYFDGYGQFLGHRFRHRRRITLADTRWQLCDEWDTDKPVKHVESYLHLHPDVTVTQEHDNQLSLALNGCVLKLSTSNGIIRLKSTWYCPEYNLKIPRKTLVVSPQSCNQSSLLVSLDW